MQKIKHYSFEVPMPESEDDLTALGHQLNRMVRKNDIIVYGNGQWAIKGRDQFIFLAWLIDLAVVYLPAVVTYLLTASVYGFASGVSIGFALLAIALLSLIYGFSCAYHRTFGNMAAHTRIVRLKDGGILGFWRSGWVMFMRLTLFPVLIMVMSLGATGGGSPTVSSEREYHVSLDDAAMKSLSA